MVAAAVVLPGVKRLTTKHQPQQCEHDGCAAPCRCPWLVLVVLQKCRVQYARMFLAASTKTTKTYPVDPVGVAQKIKRHTTRACCFCGKHIIWQIVAKNERAIARANFLAGRTDSLKPSLWRSAQKQEKPILLTLLVFRKK